MKIELKEITKRYGRKEVLRGVSFATESGRCVGILGGNGSGKSTLLSILAGTRKRDGGAFLYDGVDLFARPRERAKLVGYVPQGTPLLEELTALDNLRLWYDRVTLERELSSGALGMLGVGDFLKVTVGKLSGGMKKRLSIGCAIAGHPPILLLDEPMSALDLVCKQNILRFLQAHKAAGGILLLVTHDLPDLALCDELYVLKEGRAQPVAFDGDPETVVKSL